MTLEEYEELLGSAVRAALAANDPVALEAAKARTRDYLNKRFANEIAGIHALPRFKQFVPRKPCKPRKTTQTLDV